MTEVHSRFSRLGFLNYVLEIAYLRMVLSLLFFLIFFNTFYICIVPVRFLPWEIRAAFPGESQLRQSRSTQPTVHAECFSVSIIHRTLTRTTGSLTCAQKSMHAIAHGSGRTHVRESALKVDSGRKIPCRTGGNRTCLSGVPVRRSTN